jgi:hypothetical protein
VWIRLQILQPRMPLTTLTHPHTDPQAHTLPSKLNRKAELKNFTAPKDLMEDLPRGDVEPEDDVAGAFGKGDRITDRESDYSKRRLNRALSPTRNDAFAMGDKTPAGGILRISTRPTLKRQTESARPCEHSPLR